MVKQQQTLESDSLAQASASHQQSAMHSPEMTSAPAPTIKLDFRKAQLIKGSGGALTPSASGAVSERGPSRSSSLRFTT